MFRLTLSKNHRKYISEIDPYIPGKSIEDVKDEYDLEYVIRLASNENPFGPSPKVVEAVKKTIDNLGLYPDTGATKLRKLLAKSYKIGYEEIMTANGADEILSLLISAYINDGDEVIYGSPTFSTYRSETILMGGVPVECSLTDDWKYDLNKILNSINKNTKMIILCNPNNPTGTAVSDEDLKKFLNSIPKNILIVLDEAYIEYYEHETGNKSGIDFYKYYSNNLFIVRTFSKFYGLAGLRIGYLIASQENLEPIQRIRPAFATNRVAIEAACAAFKDQEYANKHAIENTSQKRFLTTELEDLGYSVVPSTTNFLLVNMNKNCDVIFKQLLSKGIIIRPCSQWDLDNFIRVTVGREKENRLLVRELSEL